MLHAYFISKLECRKELCFELTKENEMISLNADGEIIRAEKGDMVFFPSGSRHGLIGCGSEDCTYYEIFSPPRVDYVAGWIGKTQLRWD